MREAPAWAQLLVAQVCKDYNRKPPAMALSGKRSNGGYYRPRRSYLRWNTRTGTYNKRRTIEPAVIVIKGDCELSKHTWLVVLHEVAHHLAPRGHSHSKVFWRKAWALYTDYPYPTMDFGEWFEYCKKSEFAYKAGAERVYKQLFGEPNIFGEPAPSPIRLSEVELGINGVALGTAKQVKIEYNHADTDN